MKKLKETRLSWNAKQDRAPNLRFHRDDVAKFGLEPSTAYRFVIKHSDGIIVEADGRTTKALDKAYLGGLRGKGKKYAYVVPGFKDTRPLELIAVHKLDL